MPSILSLPFELLLKTAELLLPTDTALIDDNVEDLRDIAANIKRVNDALDDVRNLTLTCRQLGSLTIKLSRGLRLVGGTRQNRFLQDLDDVSSKVYGRNTRYLSLERPTICDSCGYQLSRDYHDHDAMTRMLLSKFPSTTTLDLANYRISFDTIHSLTPLKSLRTLSIRDPAPGWCMMFGALAFRRNTPLPQLENMIISISDFGASHSVRTAIWCFEPSLKTLFIEGAKQSNPGEKDFLSERNGIYMGHATAQYRNLKQVSIGYLGFETCSLRNFVSRISGLEILSVDCRGAPGLIPLFYAIDLLRELCDDDEGWIDLTNYDAMRNRPFGDLENLPVEPYIQEARVWRRSLAKFGCTFGVSGQDPDTERWIKSLELVFASADIDSSPLNEDMQIAELVEVFERRQASFNQLESLSISMSKDREFRSLEEDIGETMSTIIGAHLPSLRYCRVDWGNIALCLTE